jgi:methionyl-tRNA formyltransferase
VATIPLERLWGASQKEDCNFELSAIVTQPPRRKGRGASSIQHSPVHVKALELGFPEDEILMPVKAREVLCQLSCTLAPVHIRAQCGILECSANI